MSLLYPKRDTHITRGTVYHRPGSDIIIEFGQTQMNVSFSAKGIIQRKLRLKNDDRVIVVIKKEE